MSYGISLLTLLFPLFYHRDFSHFWHGIPVVLFSFPGSCKCNLECSHRREQRPKKGILITVDVINDTHALMKAYLYLVHTHTYIWDACLKHYSWQLLVIKVSVSSQKWKTEKRKEWMKGIRSKSEVILPRKRACSRRGRCRAQSSRTLWSTTISVMKITAILHLPTYINTSVSPSSGVRSPFLRIIAAIFVI